jgi:hypothetical protein
MIWFFLMGMIAGAVGVVLVLRWWMLTHMKPISKEEFLEEINKLETEDKAHE